MKETNCVHKPLFRNDVILVAVLLWLSFIGILYLFVFREGGNTVRVTVDGELYGVYSLSETVAEEIGNGEHLNRFVIRDGKVYMESATCPDGICVDHRPIFRNGESIVCLPNRVVITVVVDGETDEPDIVA